MPLESSSSNTTQPQLHAQLAGCSLAPEYSPALLERLNSMQRFGANSTHLNKCYAPFAQILAARPPDDENYVTALIHPLLTNQFYRSRIDAQLLDPGLFDERIAIRITTPFTYYRNGTLPEEAVTTDLDIVIGKPVAAPTRPACFVDPSTDTLTENILIIPGQFYWLSQASLDEHVRRQAAPVSDTSTQQGDVITYHETLHGISEVAPTVLYYTKLYITFIAAGRDHGRQHTFSSRLSSRSRKSMAYHCPRN